MRVVLNCSGVDDHHAGVGAGHQVEAVGRAVAVGTGGHHADAAVDGRRRATIDLGVDLDVDVGQRHVGHVEDLAETVTAHRRVVDGHGHVVLRGIPGGHGLVD